jgi:probable phosphoglycerate mutase
MITAYTDGGARGNPGPAGYGVYIEDEDGQKIAELKGALGETTNNVAEYRGLIAALEWAVQQGHRALRLRADSLLLIKQMRGEFRVKNPGLQRLHETAERLAAQLEHVTFEYVTRELNTEADRLANAAMDEAAALSTVAGGPDHPIL